MKLTKKAGATSEIWQVWVADSSSTTGAGLTGLLFNTASLTAYYHRDTDTTATAITLVTMTVGTFTSSGFKEIDATNMPGWYQFCPPNAAIAAGAKSCALILKGATNMAQLPIEVQLTAVDVDSATAFVTSVASVTTVTTVTNQLTAAQIATGVWQDTTAGDFTTASSIGKSLYTSGNAPGAASGIALVGSNVGSATSVSGAVGSVTGAVGSVTARVTANTDQLAGQTVTAAAGVTFPTSVASPTNITAGVITTVGTLTTYTGNTPQTGDSFARLGAPVGASHSADVAAVKAVLPAALVSGRIDASVGAMAAGVHTAAAFATDAIDATVVAASAASEIAAAVLAGTVEGSSSLKQMVQDIGAATAGKNSGAGTGTVTFRNVSDTADGLVATIDGSNNRTAITRTRT